MKNPSGSVRMGPISLFTLVIVLCLAVLGVLSITTAQATYTAAEKQATFAADTYANESAAQSFVASIDEALAGVRKAGGTIEGAFETLDRLLPNNARREGHTVSATFTTPRGRMLSVELVIRENATYEITAWKATTQWTDTDAGETLWSGNKQEG